MIETSWELQTMNKNNTNNKNKKISMMGICSKIVANTCSKILIKGIKCILEQSRHVAAVNVSLTQTNFFLLEKQQSRQQSDGNISTCTHL